MADLVHQRLSDSETDYLNTTYWDIYPLFLMVKNGRTDDLQDNLHFRFDRFPAGRITKDQRKQLEYLAVSLVNTFMIAAIEGGVYPPDANAAADEALRRLSRIHDVSEITAIIRATTLRLCEMAASAVSQNSGNAHVEDAKHYMSAHLTQEIRMEDVADAVGISLSHLSRLFREKTGMTMCCFLMQERIRAARHLLAAGDAGIPEIAALLRFCDQSHFTLAFRKETGETPARYRKKHRICAPEKI